MKKFIVLLSLALVVCALLTSCVDRQSGNEDAVTTPTLDELLSALEEAFNTSTPEDGRAVAEVVYQVVGDHAEVVGCELPVGKVEILSEFEGKPVTVIADSAFNANNTISSVVLPDTITEIGNNAFMSCVAMTSVNIPASVRSIGKYAFFGCAALESIQLGAGVESIGDNAFGSCKTISEFTVAEGNRSFAVEGGVLFSADMTELVCYPTGKADAAYTIPASVKTLRDFSFAYAANLTSVKMTSVTALGDYTFSSCFGLTSVDLGSGMTVIGAGTFQKCMALKSIVIPEGVKTLGYIDDQSEAGSCFYNCMSLTEITLPASLTNIYRRSFEGCDALSKVYFNGTSAQWEDVKIGDDNDPIKNIGVVSK